MAKLSIDEVASLIEEDRKFDEKDPDFRRKKRREQKQQFKDKKLRREFLNG